MNDMMISAADVRKLLGSASGDAALLYLYIHTGGSPENACRELRMSENAYACASATLRQLGLWTEERKRVVVSGERPGYSETDVMGAMESDKDFRVLYGEVQRLMGRTLNTEELKILLGFTRYLGFSADVVSILVCYCKERARARGSLRSPSLRSIEKEAYAWAEQGIDTVEEAAAYIQRQNFRASRLGQLMKLLQIRGRNLTAGEERYASAWLEMGFDMDAIGMAYERTCLNTGGLNWAYMNKILTRWHESGLHTAAQIQAGDRKKTVPKGASGELGQAELDAIRRMMEE